MENLIKYEGKHNSDIDERFHQLNIGNISNVLYWNGFFQRIKNVKGDIVECGVGRGRSLLIISALYSIYGDAKMRKRKIYAYDSFEGFPEPTIEDSSFRRPRKGEWSCSPSGKYKYTPEFINIVLGEAGLNRSNVKIGKGFFGDILKEHPNNPIALLHIDGDLYQSYIDSLTLLYDKVSKGGIIVFDDFFGESEGEDRWPGSRQAVKEFFGKNYNKLRLSIRGTYYFVKG